MIERKNYLQHFFHGVVQEEDAEDNLTSQHKVVHHSDIADEFYSAESPRWDSTTSGRKLHKQPIKTIFIGNLTK